VEPVGRQGSQKVNSGSSNDLTHEVELAIGESSPIAQKDYQRWSQNGDLATRARAYHLSATSWARIEPEPTGAEHCRFMADYLLECLVSNPPSDGFIHTGFEAAHELAAWLKHLVRRGDTENVIRDVIARVALAYRNGDDPTRNRIETGTIEHALELAVLRPFFDAWANDAALKAAHARSLEWGLAHPER
jgi:hypothetical protein